MNVVVIGTGYVGLVAGSCFADIGHHVTCVDICPQKIDNLKNGILPIYEPGLDTIVEKNHASGRLNFTTRLHEAMDDAHIYCIAVGTPPGEDGSADLRHVLAVARQIGENLEHPAIIINKSTVPVGTAEKVRAVIAEALAARGKSVAYDVVSNPEFLKEGVAIRDFMHPDRIIIGADNEAAHAQMQALYAPLTAQGARLIAMNVRDAEMTKYAANAMLATRISFMNEIAGICEHLGVDVENVRLGIGSDPRIGSRFIHPGAGYGGSCFPKDVRALVSMAESTGYEPHVLHAVETRNRHQKNRLYQKLRAELGDNLKGKTIAVWGLAFKPGTDDMREAPSIDLIGIPRAGLRAPAPQNAPPAHHRRPQPVPPGRPLPPRLPLHRRRPRAEAPAAGRSHRLLMPLCPTKNRPKGRFFYDGARFYLWLLNAAVAQQRIHLRGAAAEGDETFHAGTAAADGQDFVAETRAGCRIQHAFFFKGSEAVRR